MQSSEYQLSTFIKNYDREIITEWERAYIDFASMKYYLLYLKSVYQRHHHQFFRFYSVHIQILPLEQDVKRNFQDSIQFIDLMLTSGKAKVQNFIKYKTSQTIYLWQQLLEIVAQNEASENMEHAIYQKRGDIKLLIRIIYGNIDYLQQYISLNQKIQICLRQIHKSYVLPFKGLYTSPQAINRQSFSSQKSKDELTGSQIRVGKRKNSIQQSLEQQQTKESQNQNYLQLISKAAQDLHSSLVYLNKGQQQKINKFVRLSDKSTSTKNYFLLGLYIGLGAVIFASLIILLVLNFIALEYNQKSIQSMNYIFPMFRGVGLLILYFWGMAWNVYGFTVYKINFKNILEYGAHYSTHFQIMKRAGFFTLIFCIMLFFYLLGLEINQNKSMNLPIEYTPFVVWITFFTYIFFPNRQVFNPRGRKYFYLLVKKIALSPVVQMTFLLSYATDQLVSFIVPIKDFAYTLCFYTSDFTVSDVKSCLKADSFNGVIVAYIVALVPLLLRMIQCFNQARQASGKFIGHLQMWNFGKYLASVITSTLSFLNSISPSLLPFFIASSIISTSYSYYWDLKNDWGFLEKDSKNRFLRNHLCYKKPSIYYTAIFLNLIFRCSWTLTISPSVVQLIPKSTFLPFLTGLIQIFRRCMWNFFRIQKEHVINCASYTIIKQKPDDILKRLRQVKTSKPFKVVDDNESSLIHYVKLSSNDQINYYSKLMNLQLPLINKQIVGRYREQFQKIVSQEKDVSQHWQRQIKSHIFYRIKEKFY